MTTRANQREGQVFDLGYRRYEGPREGRSRSRQAVYFDGLRIALGIGRGGRAKILPWVFIFAAIIPALVLAIIAGTVDRVVGPGAAESVDLPSHSDYYSIASIILFLFAAAAAPELLCPDRRHGVINLYLVRPLTGTDYVFARWLAFLSVMVLVAWLPQIVLLAGLVFGATQPGDYLKDNWQDIPKFLVSGAAIALYTTSLAMAVASFTTRRAYAAAFLIGLFVISTPLTAGLSESIDGALGEWIALLNLTNVPLHINDWLFGSTSGVLEDSRVLGLPRAVRVSSFFVVTAAAVLVMWNRYRKMGV
jgi:ABC-2 type transport system permease protein